MGVRGGPVVEMRRGELVRRAMAVTVTRTVLDLVANHHRTEAGRPIKLDHQWKQVYADPAPDMRLIAGAQRGKTLYEMVKTMAQVMLNMSVGWVMPKDGKIQELVHGKLDPTIQNTAIYRDMQGLSGGTDTVKFKTFGRYGKLYLVTANSENELTSFSADAMHIDERDFCNRSNLPMYPSRMNFSPYKLTDEISTPTIEGTKTRVGQAGADNIHAEFLSGDQHRYYVNCPFCNRAQILDWYDNLVSVKTDAGGRVMGFDVRDKDWAPGSSTDIRACCAEPSCGRPIDRLAAGTWIAGNRGARIRSYWMEALNSSVGPSMAELLDKFGKALGNPSKMQQFHNMELGRPFAGGMLRFGAELFEGCEDAALSFVTRSEGPCTMGIDVNRPWLDVHISKWVDGIQIKVFVGKIEGGEDELVELVRRYHVTGGVIDHQPETKFAMRLQDVLWDRTRCRLVRCKYASNEQTSFMVITEHGERSLDPPKLITVNRTVAIDTLYESMQLRSVVWPGTWRTALDGALIEEFVNPVRMLVVNDQGQERFTWEGKPDHQLHAAVYDYIAGEVLDMRRPHDLSSVQPLVSTMTHGAPSVSAAPPMIQRDDQPLIMRG